MPGELTDLVSGIAMGEQGDKAIRRQGDKAKYPACIINMSGYDFRKGQGIIRVL